MRKTIRTKPADLDANPATVAAPAMPTQMGKIGLFVVLLHNTDGATIEAMMAATGWQAHSVRGAISGAVKKRHCLNVISKKTDTGRIYRIAPAAGA
jgi:hypothetical protein